MGQDFREKTKYARTGEKNYLKFRHNENCWGNYANFIRKSNALSRTSKGPFPVPNPIPFPALCPVFLPLRVLFFQAAKKKESRKKMWPKSESSIYAATNSLSYAECYSCFYHPKCSLMYAHFWFHLLDFPATSCAARSNPSDPLIHGVFF